MIKKPLFVVILIFTLLLLGCSNIAIEDNTKKSEVISKDSSDNGFTIDEASNVIIYYGASSYAMFGTDEETLGIIKSEFSNLTFEPTEEKIDKETLLRVIFSDNENGVAYNVDKKGIFIFDGKPYDYYKVSSGSFNYELIRKIYRESKYK